MTSRETSLLEFWRKKKEKGDAVRGAHHLLPPAQLRRLLSDSGVRAALQNTQSASLLPPVGTEFFRRLTPASLEEIQQRHEADEKQRKTRKKNKEVAEDDPPKPPKPAKHLEARKPLPFIYGAPPPELLYTPLEELDPFYQSKKTFVVVSRGKTLHRFNAERSCFLLSPLHLLRSAAIRILLHPLFSLFILATLLLNCVFLSVQDRPAWSEAAEYVFVAVYTLEVIIKVMSRGFCLGRFTFLRDPWNWLDLLIVSTAYLTIFVDVGSFSVLRILKILGAVPGLRMTVGALVQSVRRLCDVIALTLFCLGLLALIGLQLFMGHLRQKCVAWTPNVTDLNFHEYINDPVNLYYLPGQLDALLCGNSSDSGRCPDGFICLRTGSNPNYGYTSFDSFGWSLLSLIRLMARDFPENLLMLTMRAAGKSYLTFFVVAVFPACFCVVSLIVVVVAMTSVEREAASVAEAEEREAEFTQVVEVLKRSEEEEQAASGAALSQGTDGHTAVEGCGARRSCPPCWNDSVLKWNCCGCWRWLKQRLDAFITNPFFDLGIVICLIINVIFMSMEHYPMTQQFEGMLQCPHLVFTAIFTAEMVIKMAAMDPYGYFQVGWNIFDCFIVVSSLVELGLADIEGLTALRCLRLMRVFRLARWWPSFNMFLTFIWTSMRTLVNLVLLLLIMVFFFTIAGMELFGRAYKDCVCRISEDCSLPRWHMNDFFHAFMVVTRALGGGWIETMWDCMEVAGQATCLIFFMMVVVIGNLLVLTLFLSLLLSSLNSYRPEEKDKDVLQITIKNAVRALRGEKVDPNPDHTAANGKEDDRKEYLALTSVTSDQSSEIKTLSGHHGNLTSNYQSVSITDAAKTPETEGEKEKKKHPEDDEDHKENTPEDCCSDKCYRCCPFLDIDTSRGGGRVWSNFRRACLAIVQHSCFEIFMIIVIALSSTALMFEDIHLQHRPVLEKVVKTADLLFTILFLMEMFLKWIAFGLKKYFSDAWCWFDFLVVQVFLVFLTVPLFGYTDLRMLQSLRALGPLRIVSRFQGLKVVVQTVVRSLPSLFDFLLVALVLWLVFSVLGVNLFAGKFYYCFNETSEEMFLAEDVNNKTECLILMHYNYTEIRWKNLQPNYDHVANGYLSLLHVASSSGGFDTKYAAVDSTQVESQPVYEANLYMYLYFICFIISCFFINNIFIRVIIDNLQRDKIRKQVYMSEEQQRYYSVVKKRQSLPQKPCPPPQNRFQALVTTLWFEVFFVAVTCLNMVVLMVDTYDQSEEKWVILYWFHFTFIIIYLIEFILKIIALRQHYFTDGWNVLDFVVVFGSLVGMFLADLVEKYFVTPSLFPLLRLPRVFRILHLLRYARGVQKLLFVTERSLPALFNISFLLFLIMFTSSLFGMFNFAYVKKGAMIDDMFNFETFWNSMICLILATTSGSWDGLVHPMMYTPPDCDPLLENPGYPVRGDCGNPTLSIVFFVIHIYLCLLLVIHLYVAVVLEAFSSEDAALLSDDDLEMFHKTWKKFDPEASQFIEYSQLSEFCDALKDPLRNPKPNTIKLVHMDLPLHPGDKVHSVDVLLALAKQVSGDSEKTDTLKARMEEKFNPPKVSCEPISSTLQRKQEEVAAAVIQRAFRKHAQEKATVDGGGV